MPGREAAAAAPRALVAAATFLTRLPGLGRVPVADADLVRGAVAFPLVGGALGGLVGATAALLAGPLPALAAAGLAVAVEAIVTGALHLDGLADSADGLAGRDREHALAIMRDHTVGAYGAMALGLDLLVKATALGALAARSDVAAVVAAYAVSRAAPLALAAALPYARAGGGTGRLLAERLRWRHALAGVVLAAAIAAPATGLGAIGALACLVAIAAGVGATARRRIAGVTGDVLGAAIELTATAALAVAAATRP